MSQQIQGEEVLLERGDCHKAEIPGDHFRGHLPLYVYLKRIILYLTLHNSLFSVNNMSVNISVYISTLFKYTSVLGIDQCSSTWLFHFVF